MAAALSVHLLAAVVWVGGMLMMLSVVRPAAVALIEPPLRLRFFCEMFRRFFALVWLAIGALLVTGFWMALVPFGGFAAVGFHVHMMLGLGLLMVGLFAFLYWGPYARMKQALQQEDYPQAAATLAVIRRIVTVNTGLGVAVVLVASAGRYI